MTLTHALPLLVIAAAVAQAAPPAAEEPLAKPRIVIFKAKRELQLFDGEKLIKSYRVGLGEKPVPPKEREGDMATPEGTYFICHKNPKSKFHLSLAISYPGPADAKRGLKDGLITDKEYKAIMQADAARTTPPFYTKLGGEVFIHGRGSATDWTWGCVALDDPDIEDLYKRVPVKTPVTIHP